ncbi:MAG: type II toxin-antitoxin system PemK/MazF family toxin [Streptosporangiaceae bacterium]
MPVPGGPLLRGRVYAAKIPSIDPDHEKYFLVVSNNRRNEQLPQVLAIRLTTTPKPQIPSVVELGHPEPFVGRACCDDIEALYPDEVTRDMGALTRGGMARVEAGLRAALGLEPTNAASRGVAITES